MSETVTHDDIQKEIAALRAELETHIPYIRSGIEGNSLKAAEAVRNTTGLSESFVDLNARMRSLENAEIHSRLGALEKATERAAGVRTGILLVVSAVSSAVSLVGAYIFDYLLSKP